jgi:SAM-dependent methyltransferase
MLPFADNSFDRITAFEVIEHLDRWPDLLTEACRTLKPQGILLVSTPNKSYYAEMRAKIGPNPYHRHEFEYAEFETALYTVFPHVRIWAQNHASAIVFASLCPAAASLEADGDPHPENAHFFLAACSRTEIEYADLYAWLPASANVLREREHHIARLEGELAKKDDWLARLEADHAELHKAHEQALADVKARSLWAQRATAEVKHRDQTIHDLQEELEERLAWAHGLDADLDKARAEITRLDAAVEARTNWALLLEEQLTTRNQHVEIQKREIEEHKAAVEWLLKEVDAGKQRIAALEAERALIARSKWIRLGQSVKLGPTV